MMDKWLYLNAKFLNIPFCSQFSPLSKNIEEFLMIFACVVGGTLAAHDNVRDMLVIHVTGTLKG